MSVKRSHRQRGVAQKLLHACLQHVRNVVMMGRSVEQVVLFTTEMQKEALRLYEKENFVLTASPVMTSCYTTIRLQTFIWSKRLQLP